MSEKVVIHNQELFHCGENGDEAKGWFLGINFLFPCDIYRDSLIEDLARFFICSYYDQPLTRSDLANKL
jgi:hypothetical protein